MILSKACCAFQLQFVEGLAVCTTCTAVRRRPALTIVANYSISAYALLAGATGIAHLLIFFDFAASRPYCRTTPADALYSMRSCSEEENVGLARRLRLMLSRLRCRMLLWRIHGACWRSWGLANQPKSLGVPRRAKSSCIFFSFSRDRFAPLHYRTLAGYAVSFLDFLFCLILFQ